MIDRAVDDAAFYAAILSRVGYVEDGERTADGSADNDLAAERADAILSFIDLVRGSALPEELLPAPADQSTPAPAAEPATVDATALREKLIEAFNAAYIATGDAALDETSRHDGHRYSSACYVCRGDVDKLADAVLSVVAPVLAAKDAELERLRAFHKRALDVREAVTIVPRLPGQTERSRYVTSGAAAVMDDLFHHADTPEQLQLPRLLSVQRPATEPAEAEQDEPAGPEWCQVACCEAGMVAYPSPCPWHGKEGHPAAPATEPAGPALTEGGDRG